MAKGRGVKDSIDLLWTPLPPLPLRGMGTPFVESLDYYALRLAGRCGVARTTLARLLRGHAQLKIGRPFALRQSSWVGPTSEYLTLLLPLMKFTGQADLFRGTFHCVSGVLSLSGLANNNGINSGRRWCPRCYLEWNDEDSWEPLLWAFTMLAACPIHGVLLEGVCPTCGARQPTDQLFRRRRNCSKCKRHLGHEGKPAELQPTQSWVDGKLVNFVQFISSLEQPIEKSTVADIEMSLKYRIKLGETIPSAIRNLLSDLRNASRQQVTSLLRPTIAQYLNLCAFQGCEVGDILSHPKIALGRPLFDRALGFTQLPLPKRAWKLEIQEIGFCLEVMLSDPTLLLPPLRALCAEYRVWHGELNEYFPSTRYRYLERQKAQVGQFRQAHERRCFKVALRLSKESLDKYQSLDGIESLAADAAAAARVTAALSLECAKAVVRLRELQSTFDPAIERNREQLVWHGYASGMAGN